jgi:hypothetical protein
VRTAVLIAFIVVAIAVSVMVYLPEAQACNNEGGTLVRAVGFGYACIT